MLKFFTMRKVSADTKNTKNSIRSLIVHYPYIQSKEKIRMKLIKRWFGHKASSVSIST